MSRAPQPPEPWRPPSPLPGPLRTDRLVIRWWTPDDAPAQLAALDAGPPGRAAFIPWLLPWVREDNHDVAQCVFHIERFRRAREQPDADDFVLGIFDRTTGDVVGGTGFHRIDRASRRGEIGYWIRADRHGQGLATEAVRALLTWGFDTWRFHKIVIHCAAGNIASRRVPEKLGLRREAELRDDRWIEGRGWDATLIFGVLATEWRAR